MRANYTETKQHGCSNDFTEVNFIGVHEWIWIDVDELEEFIQYLQNPKVESEKEKK